MVELINSALTRLEAGGVSMGLGIRMVRSADIGTLARTAGMDWLFIDLEHGSLSLDQTSQISVAALAGGLASIVRVPRGEMAMATRALDGGALGIVCPMCETAEEAAAIVERLHYPPEGRRSVVGGLPQFGYGTPPMTEVIAAMNGAMLVVVMIESQQGVDNVEAIAAVEGVDVVLIGTNDLAAGLGIPGQVGHERIVACYEKIAAACRTHGKWLGMGGVGDPALQEKYIGMGVRFVLAGQDFSYLMAGAKSTVDRVRTYG